MSVILAKDHKAMRPGAFRLYLRTSVVWQFIRFLLINLKMTKMILKSHGGKNTPEVKD